MGRPHPALFDLAADRPVDAFDPAGIVTSAIEHRMGGILATRLASGEMDLDAASRIRLEEVDLATWARNQMLAEAATKVTSAAEDVGMRVVIIKGLPSEARWYDRAGERPSYDVDLAVHPEDLELIPELVQRLHPGHSLLPHLRLLIRQGVLQSVDLAVNDLPVDLHWDPLKLPLIKTRAASDLWERTELVKLPNDHLVPTFDTEVALICHLAHLNKDRFRYLLGFVDVARITLRGNPDWAFIERLLDREGLRTPIAESLSAVYTRLQLPGSTPLQANGVRAQAWRLLWPVDQQLLGDAGRTQLRYRSLLIPLTGKGRFWESVLGYLRRLTPPRQLVRYYYPHARGPYLWKIVVSRWQRRHKLRRLLTTLRDG